MTVSVEAQAAIDRTFERYGLNAENNYGQPDHPVKVEHHVYPKEVQFDESAAATTGLGRLVAQHAYEREMEPSDV